MGLTLSISHTQINRTDGPKALMLLEYSKETLKPVSLLDFISNPLQYTSNPLVLLEPFQCTCQPNTEITYELRSYENTKRIFFDHFKTQTFKLQQQNLWFIASNKLTNAQKSEAMNFIRKSKFDNYSCIKCVDASHVFYDADAIAGFRISMKPPSPAIGTRASSPIRAAGSLALGPSLMQRRSHNPSILSTFKLPTVPTGDVPEKRPHLPIPIETRDGMDCVAPNLYVGGERAAANLSLLLDKKVTHVVNLSGNSTPNHFPDTFEYFTVRMHDSDFEDIPDEFWEAIEFARNAIHERGTVLLHCRFGVSRSPALAIAIIAEEQRLSIDAALAIVKNNRPVANVNLGFVDQLKLHSEKMQWNRSKPRLLLNLH